MARKNRAKSICTQCELHVGGKRTRKMQYVCKKCAE